MIFETERLYVRKWQQNDLDCLHELYGDAAIEQYIPPVLTIEETKQIFDAQLLQYKKEPYIGRYIVIEKVSKTFIGTFLLQKPSDINGVEIGYAFRKQDWGKGFATEIVKQGIKYIFTSTEFSAIYAFTDLPNIKSKKVLLKCGFIPQRNIYEYGSEVNVFTIKKASLKINSDY